MYRIIVLLLVLLPTVGCLHPTCGAKLPNVVPGVEEHRYKVARNQAHGWWCEGTLWFYPDTKRLYCEGTTHITVDGYDVKK